MIYLIADLHFNHKKIALHCNRPTDWQERVIRYCQALVKPEDFVVCLGDFGWGSWKKLNEILKSLPGYWIIIPGNHDQVKDLKKMAFHLVLSEHGAPLEIKDYDLQKYDLFPKFFYIKDNREGDPRDRNRESFGDLSFPQIALSHRPFIMIEWPYFYGHIHNSPFAYDHDNQAHPPLFAVEGQNLSLEVINYKPVPLPVLLHHHEWLVDNWREYFINHFGFEKKEVEEYEKAKRESLPEE